jgi:enoyl-[acyl-carrier protein] reductase II
MLEMEAQGKSIEEIVAFRGRSRARAGCIEGNLRDGILPAGAAVGLVRSVKPAADVVRELVEGCEQVFAALRAALPGDGSDLGGTRAA